MFSSKPFGSGTSSGFGSFGSPQPNANPFAQNQLFNKTPSTTGGFGATQTTFGQQAGTSLFTGPQTQTNLFQNANTSAFGATPTSQTGFGAANLFGQQQQQQPSTSGLFGGSTFGQQNKPSAFGFGTPQTQSGIFGQQQAQPQTQGSSLFQPSTSTNIFGQSTSFGGTGQTGTVIKFNPVTGTDTMQKSGIATSISTKHHCITCMKEYESKSLEELRYEDYLANRKGPQQQTGFGTTPFGAPVSSSAPSLFGQTENKPAFGQTTTFGQTTSGFGQNTGFGLQNQQTPSNSLFGKPAAGFGVASTGGTTFGFGTNTTTNVPFGTPQQTKPFGATTQPLFATNTAQQQSAFGTGIFGQTGTQANTGTSLFGKPAQPAATPAQGFSFPQPTTTTSSLFQQPKMGFNMFGQTPTSTISYGQTSAFGQPQATFASGNTLNKPVGSTFPATPGFGVNFNSGQQNTTPSLFGTNQQKPGGFFDTSGGLFAGRNMQQPAAGGFGMQQPQQAIASFPTADSAESVLLVANTQFPFSPHLAGLTPTTKADTSTYATNPKELISILDAGNRITTKTPTLKLRPITRGQKTGLFSEEDELFKNYIMNTQKRLILKKPTDNTSFLLDDDADLSEHVQSIMQRIEEDDNSKEAAKNLEKEEDIAAARSRSSIALAAPVPQREVKESGAVETHRTPVEEEKKAEEKPVHYPCGIVLTRPEYFTVPPLSEIEQYKNDDGTCLVKGFTVGRIGYGNVYFPDVMDVSNLNLDEIVFFRFKEVTVYPDGYPNKPPVGQGLNRRAQITLDHVYPTVHGQQVKDLDKLVELGYINNLKESCARQGCKFLEYRVESGSWVFESKHFTTYSVDFHDDYSSPPQTRPSEIPSELTQQGLEGTSTPPQRWTFTYRMTTFEEAQETRPEMITESYRQRNIYHETDPPLRQIVMRRALFSDDPLTAIDLSDHGDYEGSGSAEGTSLFNLSALARLVPPGPREYPKEVYAAPKPYVSVLQNRFGRVPPEKSLLRGLRSYLDQRIFKGESFRCGWMSGLKFISIGDEVLVGRYWSSIIDVNVIDFKDPNQEPTDDFILTALETLHSEVTSEVDGHGCPTFKVNVGPSFLTKQTELFKGFVKTPDTTEYMKYLASVWDLCFNLWGPLVNETDLRKDYVSEWLRVTVYRPIINHWSIKHSNNMPFEQLCNTVLELLSINYVRDAAELLMINRCPQLSLLVAELSSSDRIHHLLSEQLVFWYQSMIEEYIPLEMKKIYLLLSGNAVINEVNICENFDWKRAFGLHLWYVAPTNSPLHEAMRVFKLAFTDDEPYAAKPLPPYAVADTDSNTYCVLYHLLSLFCSEYYILNHILNPATHTADPLDYRMSWLLLQLFRSLEVGLIDEESENTVITNFAAQLENMNEWQWAIYVLLFMKDNKVKQQFVTRILERNLSLDVDEETDQIDDILVNKMKLPHQWIHTVKAYKATYLGLHWLSYAHFAHAGDYYKSNDIFVEHLLAPLVVNEQFEQLQQAVALIEPYSHKITTWKYQIGLILDFLKLEKKFEGAQEQEELRRLHTELVLLVTRLPEFPQNNETQKLCMAEVSRKCALFQRILVENVDDPTFIHTFVQVMDHLVMPPDYMFVEGMYYFRKLTDLP